jgi:hypothetical protein
MEERTKEDRCSRRISDKAPCSIEGSRRLSLIYTQETDVNPQRNDYRATNQSRLHFRQRCNEGPQKNKN